MEEAGASAVRFISGVSADKQDIEERLGSLKNAAKFFGEHKDRAFEAKVRKVWVNADERWPRMLIGC